MPQLGDHFDGVMIKRLSKVETDRSRSNQHEFNGTAQMKQHLGDARRVLSANFIHVGRDEDERVITNDMVTWYDAREQHPTRSEHRLYFHDNEVMAAATLGDVLIVGLRKNQSLLMLIVDGESEDLPSILWMFGAKESDLGVRLAIDPVGVEQQSESIFNLVAEVVGLEIETETGDNWLDDLLARFGSTFPPTRKLSAFALETLHQELSPTDAPDSTLLRLMDREELLFRQLERHIVSQDIQVSAKGWTNDVDQFIKYSLSVHNRRKSRAGHALEHHLEWILHQNNVTFDHGVVTEGRSKPDFLFPGQRQYHDADFPADKLSMLGAKTSCKDRWRQVLNEAARIQNKHLFTLQPTISEHQINEMRSAKLTLVVPAELHKGFTAAQRQWLLPLDGFIRLVQDQAQSLNL